jgi:tryptophanyl-tRNA synthetase
MVSLTGVKPTGDLHLGNYIGAILPALELARVHDAIYFIADYHALTSIRDPEELRHYSRGIAAAWIAAGLDPARTLIYRQSDVPEIPELTWIFACLTAKGLMNRAHAYKAARDRNAAAGNADVDAGVNMGLYLYPVLMAVDILIMEADVVPVGRDQVQHVEYAADLAGTFNHFYGKYGYRFKIPKAITSDDDNAATLPGTDGRKMSKSYGNTLPLFGSPAALKKLVRRIPTDSVPVEEPKDPGSSAVFQIYAQVADPKTVAAAADRLRAGGVGWGEVKALLLEELETRFAPMRERYDELMTPSSELDQILADGAQKARRRAGAVLGKVRSAIGIAG